MHENTLLIQPIVIKTKGFFNKSRVNPGRAGWNRAGGVLSPTGQLETVKVRSDIRAITLTSEPPQLFQNQIW
ncbi:hypothetical protein RRG08_033130 [Elysia crispata]|uniref:Uncharacterized protein n=1 Tax=Elysia crispata TaxID=231223 RepID=A0AAE1CQD2_9GAST|nr:hypothetical protein RRG08_033130 [Elysia crispata]